MTRTPTPRKSTRGRRKSDQVESRMIPFNWQGQDYVLDLGRNRVYQNFTAVEASRGFAILGAYRHHAVSV
jgi:hypothetical protein